MRLAVAFGLYLLRRVPRGSTSPNKQFEGAVSSGGNEGDQYSGASWSFIANGVGTKSELRSTILR